MRVLPCLTVPCFVLSLAVSQRPALFWRGNGGRVHLGKKRGEGKAGKSGWRGHHGWDVLSEKNLFQLKKKLKIFVPCLYIHFFQKNLNFPHKKRTMRTLKISRTGMLSAHSSAVLKSVVSYTLKNPMRYRVIFLLFYISENRQCVKFRAMKNKVNQVFAESQF